MEYKTPSMFDENGFNILSPTVQMMRAEGNNPSAQSSFRYNGDNPQQTAMNNQMNPFAYNGYYQSPMNPPAGFTPMAQPNYGGFGYQYQSANPYASMMQGNMNNGIAYSYNPQYGMYDPYTQPYNPYAYTNQDVIANEGRKAKEMLQSAMNPQNNQINENVPMIKYDPWGRPIGEYSYSEIKERNAPIYNQLYKSGAMPLSEYCSFNNGGISFTGVDGKTVRVGCNDWYAGYDRIQQQKMIWEEQQKLYNENLQSWKICIEVNKKFLKDEGMDEEARRIEVEQSEQYREYTYKLQQYHYSILQFDNWYDNMCAFVNTWKRSDKPGYVTPYVEKYITDWNKLYERRTKPYPDSYGVDEFFNKGIMTNQIIDNMAHDAEIRERRVDILFDQQKCRELFGNMFPSYDPITGTSCAPVSMNVSDIEITLPENLKRERYLQRRQAFENTIFRDNRSNVIQHYGGV